MKKDQLSISIERTNTLSMHAATTNHAAASPINDRATPITKNAPIPNSAKASAAAFDTDMKDKSVVVERTTRTFGEGRLRGGTGAAIEVDAPLHHNTCDSS